jgi:hypothetical protein
LPGEVEFKVGNVLSEYGSNFLDVEKKIRSLEDRLLNDPNLWGLDSELTEIASLESSTEKLQQSVEKLLNDLAAQGSSSPPAPPKQEAQKPVSSAPQAVQAVQPVTLPYTVRFTNDPYWGTCESVITESKVLSREITPEGGDMTDVCDVSANRGNLVLGKSLVNQDKTITKHLELVFAKLGVETRTAAANIAACTWPLNKHNWQKLCGYVV